MTLQDHKESMKKNVLKSCYVLMLLFYSITLFAQRKSN